MNPRFWTLKLKLAILLFALALGFGPGLVKGLVQGSFPWPWVTAEQVEVR